CALPISLASTRLPPPTPTVAPARGWEPPTFRSTRLAPPTPRLIRPEEGASPEPRVIRALSPSPPIIPSRDCACAGIDTPESKASDRSALEKSLMILLLWDQSDLVATKKNRSYAPKFYHEKFNNIRRLRRINRFVKTILNPLKIKKARNLGSAPHRGHIEGASAFAPPPTMMAIRG